VTDCETARVYCRLVVSFSTSRTGIQVQGFPSASDGLQHRPPTCEKSLEKSRRDNGVKRRSAVADFVAAVTDCETAGMYRRSVIRFSPSRTGY
jgi:hypothetical protein